MAANNGAHGVLPKTKKIAIAGLFCIRRLARAVPPAAGACTAAVMGVIVPFDQRIAPHAGVEDLDRAIGCFVADRQIRRLLEKYGVQFDERQVWD